MPQIETREVTRKGVASKPKKARPMTSDEAFAKLSDAAADNPSVVIRVTDVARHLGKPQSTVSGWLKRWVSEGRISMDRQPGKGAKIVFLHKAVRPSASAPVDGGFDASNGASSVSSESASDTPLFDGQLDGGFDVAKPSSESSSDVALVDDRESADVLLFRPTKPAIDPSKRTRKRHRQNPAAPLALPSPILSSAIPVDVSAPPIPVEVAPVQPSTPALHVTLRTADPDRLPFFRDANAMRFLAISAAAASIVMVAYHAAAADAENPVKWAMVLFVALVTATAKPILGLLSENLRAGGDRSGARIAVAVGLLALMIDAMILYGFRGEGLANRAAIDAAAEASRSRVVERIDMLRTEQKRLTAAEAGPNQPAVIEGPATRLPGELRPLIAALDEGADPKGECRWLQPRAERGKPVPEKRRANATKCEAELATLRSELARAEAAEATAAHQASEVATRRERLADLPRLIDEAEKDLAEKRIHGSTDGGAALIARGLNWLPAGVASAAFGIEEFHPVEADGVLTGLTWGFVLVIELLALYGLGLASRCDRARRNRLGLS